MTEAQDDIVAIFRAEDMSQVLQLARPQRAEVSEGADLMEHPLEDGSLIADHIVALPVLVDLPSVVVAEDLVAVFDECRRIQREGELLVIQTQTATHDNMVLLSFPHDESPDAVSRPFVLLRFKQAQFVTPEYGALANGTTRSPAQSSTTPRGQQPARAATASTNGTASTSNARNAQTEQKGSTLYRLFNRGGRG